MDKAVDKAGLIAAAKEAASASYSPYSNFSVGAAVLTSDNKVFSGCNVENVSYSLTLCAERTALVKAVSEQTEKGFNKAQEKPLLIALAVWADSTVNGHVTPCGACRQVMLELMASNARVYWMNANTNTIEDVAVFDLLPYPFDEAALGFEADADS